jgi:hypothetical protein
MLLLVWSIKHNLKCFTTFQSPQTFIPPNKPWSGLTLQNSFPSSNFCLSLSFLALKSTMAKVTFQLGLVYNYRGLVHYHYGSNHGIVLEELRILHFGPNSARDYCWKAASRKLDFTSGRTWALGDIKAYTHRETLLPEVPHLQIVPLSITKLWKTWLHGEQTYFKSPQTVMCFTRICWERCHQTLGSKKKLSNKISR